MDIFRGFLDDRFKIIRVAIKDSVVLKLLLIKNLDGFVREEFQIKIVVDITEEALIKDCWASDVRIIAIAIRLLHRDDIGPLLLEENENGMLIGHPAAAIAFGHQRRF